MLHENLLPKRKGRKKMMTLTYCEVCSENLDDEAFDYRFDFPICLNCVMLNKLEPNEEK